MVPTVTVFVVKSSWWEEGVFKFRSLRLSRNILVVVITHSESMNFLYNLSVTCIQVCSGKLSIIITVASIYWGLGCTRHCWGWKERAMLVLSRLAYGQPWKARALTISVTRCGSWGTEKLGNFSRVTWLIQVVRRWVTVDHFTYWSRLCYLGGNEPWYRSLL